MSKGFEGGQKEPVITNEPQLTSFTGVGEVEKVRLTGTGKNQCIAVS